MHFYLDCSSETALYVLWGNIGRICIRVLYRPKMTQVKMVCHVIASFRGTEPDVWHNVVGLHFLTRPLRFRLTICHIPALDNRNFRISEHVTAVNRNVTCPFSQALTCTNQNEIITSWGIYKLSNKVNFPHPLNKIFPDRTAQSSSRIRMHNPSSNPRLSHLL